MKSRELSVRIAALLDSLTDAGAVDAEESQRIRAEVRRVQKRRRWDKQNLVTVSTKLTKREAARFDRYCRAQGLSRYEVLRSLVETVMRPFD